MRLILISRFILALPIFTAQENWKLQFPSGSGMGLFLAVALPLDLPGRGTYLSYNFEANYALPSNNTNLVYPPIVSRESRKFEIDRKLVYDALESKFRSHGYSGRDCILRTICEASAYTMYHVNGVLGDILHILFTPSSSQNEGLTSAYEKAERTGMNTKNCVTYEKKCSISILDVVTWIEHAI